MKIIGYDAHNFEHFKQCVGLAVAKCQSDGLNIVAKTWRKKSPFQKNRYNEEFVFPECWIYSSVVGGNGLVINGEDVDGDYKKVVEIIKNIYG